MKHGQMTLLLLGSTLCWTSALVAGQTSVPPPIIDMHLHAFALEGGEAPFNPATRKPSGASTTAELRDKSLAALERFNIVKAVTSGSLQSVAEWREKAPDRIIPGLYVETGEFGLPDLAKLRTEIEAGRVQVLGELGLQYMGLSPADPRLEPYFALAEELDIPVAIHTGLGPPGMPYDPCCPDYRATLGNPLLLEDVLVRHPKLRVWLMHAGGPFTEETKAIMSAYPQVYADLAVINWIIPREEFHAKLRELMRAGLGKRLMFGSDQMVWPEAIGLAIDGIESATFLTEEEKRDIFYNNAAKFLGLKSD